MNLSVKKIETGPFQENTFLVRSNDNNDLLILDPGDDSGVLIDLIRNHHWNPVAILNTHAHLDHIGAVAALKEEFAIPFYLPEEEEENLASYQQSCTMFGLQPGKQPEVNHWVKDAVIIGNFEIEVIRTPGHTTGSTCYRISGHVFTGDTLFKMSVGRTDLPGGNWEQLKSSLKKLMIELDDDDIIHSGHGPDTTMGMEKQRNPFLIQLS